MGCGPTYPRDKVEQGIKNLCKQEHNIDVHARLVGRTLYVFLQANNLLDESLSLGEKAYDILEKTLLSTTRVTLSSDADIQFYILVVEDHIRRIEMTFIQNIRDIKRFIFRQISREDYFSRMVIKVKVKKEEEEWFSESAVLDEMDLSGFLAQQVIWRVKREIEGNLLLRFVINMEEISGGYDRKEKTFFFTIRSKEESKAGKWQKDILTDLIVEKMWETSEKYRFDDFRGIVLRDGKAVTMSKEEMKAMAEKEKSIKKRVPK